MLLRAHLYDATGDDQASSADYTAALQLGKSEGFTSAFIDEGQPVAEALSKILKHDQLENVRVDYVNDILTAFNTVQRPA